MVYSTTIFIHLLNLCHCLLFFLSHLLYLVMPELTYLIIFNKNLESKNIFSIYSKKTLIKSDLKGIYLSHIVILPFLI